MRKLRSIVLAMAGVMSIVMGFITWVEGTDYYDTYPCKFKEYGGDAYTGIQNACALTANNEQVLEKDLCMVLKGIGYLLFVGGVALIGVAIPVGDDKTRQQPVPQEARNEPVA